MRVLLSAYACEPNKGSEPEVGWQRALHMLERADEVWVLTRSNNQTVIEADPRSHAQGLHFLYYDLPKWALMLKKRAWFLPIYCVLWQFGAYRLAAKRHRDMPFDAVFHVTFVSMLYGSWMGRLGIPFIVGPIAGGERAPLRLRSSMPIRCQASELLRDLRIVLQRYSPLARSAFADAERIFVTTKDSVRLVPRKWRFKVEVHLAIGTDRRAEQGGEWSPTNRPRFVFAGRLLHWKGIHLAIRALPTARKTVPDATLTIFGSGPEDEWLRAIARECGVTDAVEFVGNLSREQLIDSFRLYTALTFPSLHDSGGLVVLEALSAGIPAICLDIGGPGVIVEPSGGIVVPTVNADEEAVVAGIALAMIQLATAPASELQALSRRAIARANELSWTRQTRVIVGLADVE